MGKHLSVSQIMQQRFDEVPDMPKEMTECLGRVEDTFTALVYGGSGHGKTNMIVQMLRAFKSLGAMLYISWEEGHGLTIQDLVGRHNLHHELPKTCSSAQPHHPH